MKISYVMIFQIVIGMLTLIKDPPQCTLLCGQE